MPKQKDSLYSAPLSDVPKFKFDDKVAEVFPDMIQRSVPGYSTILHMIGQITERYAVAGTNCYDLGCSLGAGILAMRHKVRAPNVSIIGVDSSSAMIDRCHRVVSIDSGMVDVELRQESILETDMQNTSVCLLNFTLQFIDRNQRSVLLNKISESMNKGGALILSEKLSFDEPQHEHLMKQLHHDFKRSNGYSELEIAQKREAIEDILIPEDLDSHQQRLIQSGFSSVNLWFQCFNFASIIAIK